MVNSDKLLEAIWEWIKYKTVVERMDEAGSSSLTCEEELEQAKQTVDYELENIIQKKFESIEYYRNPQNWD